MTKLVVIFSLILGTGKLVGQIWSHIELQVLEFFMLGIIPGTDIQLTFEHILLITLSMFMAFWLFEHRSSIKRLAKLVDQTTL